MVHRVVIEKGGDFGYITHCPAIPGCHSQGNSIEEAIENIKDAIRGCLSALDEALISEGKSWLRLRQQSNRKLASSLR